MMHICVIRYTYYPFFFPLFEIESITLCSHRVLIFGVDSKKKIESAVNSLFEIDWEEFDIIRLSIYFYMRMLSFISCAWFKLVQMHMCVSESWTKSKFTLQRI